MLARMVKQENAESIEFGGGIIIEVATGNFRTVRGRTIIAALADEAAYWPSEDSANSHYEVLDALRPGMATIPGVMLLVASSLYARRGAMRDAYNRFYGKAEAPALVWKVATRTMNPSVPQRFIDDAYARDPANAAAEYGADFRTDIEALVSREVVDSCIKAGVYERSPERRYRYNCFVTSAAASRIPAPWRSHTVRRIRSSWTRCENERRRTVKKP